MAIVAATQFASSRTSRSTECSATSSVKLSGRAPPWRRTAIKHGDHPQCSSAIFIRDEIQGRGPSAYPILDDGGHVLFENCYLLYSVADIRQEEVKWILGDKALHGEHRLEPREGVGGACIGGVVGCNSGAAGQVDGDLPSTHGVV